jgi:hypothetical protein
MDKDLYTTKELSEVRGQLLKSQDGKCKASGVDITMKEAVVDHNHDDSQKVRGVLHRQINSFIGKCENAYKRLIGWWLPIGLPALLRLVADYLELPDKSENSYIHPAWIKKIQSRFNSLKESDKSEVLSELGCEPQPNAAARKEAFRLKVLSKQYSYAYLKRLIAERSSNAGVK